MAGAGFKTFNTGDVLTASDVNTYLMQQTVMVFASAAARTTALGANVAEGMISYLKDTNAVEVYDGSNWVSSDDPNAIQNTIVDAKGDIITATAADTPARLAVGTSGNILAADSSTATGLAYIPTFFAGKNKIINGDFGVWQRGTSISLTNGTQAYTADRWTALCNFSAGSASVSQQSFTAGTAPVAGYEGQFFWRMTCGSTSTYAEVSQKIEDVRTFAGQTITLSFWAKASSTFTNQPIVTQSFGSGGSADVPTYPSSFSIGTSWTRYTMSVAVPSISGKTIGTGSNLRIYPISISATLNNATIDIWGVQVEAGSTATQFQTATGTIQGELAACQRYYWRNTGASGILLLPYCGSASSTTNPVFAYKNIVTMRTAPTSVDFSNIQATDGSANYALSAVTLPSIGSADVTYISATASGLTTYRPLAISSSASAGFIGFSAEL